MKKQIAKHDSLKFDDQGYQTDLDSINGEALPNLEKLEFRKFTKGGARPGAGRRKGDRVPVTLRLRPEVRKRLQAKAKAEGKTLSDVAEEALLMMK
jgi:predicted HicB family RNase H-like nuclease